MSDEEWQSWQKAFRAKSDPLPAIQKRARRTRLGLWIGNVIFFGIALMEIVAGAGMLAEHGKNAIVGHIAGAGLILIMLGMSVGFVRLQRNGVWKTVSANPRDQLDFMALWVRSSERAAMLARMGGVVVCAFTLALEIAVWMEARPPLGVIVPSLAFVAVVFGVCWTAPYWNERQLRPRREQLEQWRRELADDVPESS